MNSNINFPVTLVINGTGYVAIRYIRFTVYTCHVIYSSPWQKLLTYQVIEHGAYHKRDTDEAHNKGDTDKAQKKSDTDDAHNKGDTDEAHNKGDTDGAHNKGNTDGAQNKGDTDEAHNKGDTDEAQRVLFTH